MKLLLILTITQSILLKIQEEIKETYKKVLPNVVRVEIENKMGTGIIYDTIGTVVTSLPFPLTNECDIINFKGEISSGELFYWDDITHIAFLKSNFNAKEIEKKKNIEVGDLVLIVNNSLDSESALFWSIVSNKRNKRIYLQGSPSIPLTGSPVFSIDGKFIGVVKGEVVEFESEKFPFIFQKNYNIVSVTLWEEIEEIKKRIGKEFKIPGWIGILIKDEGGNVIIKKVLKGSPAEKADIKPGDMILEIEREEIKNVKDLVEKMRFFSPGEKIEIKLKRKNKVEVKKVKLDRIPSFMVY
ncbi:MAG: S1C family serine protease [candidate division WOR-3 bacterium]